MFAAIVDTFFEGMQRLNVYKTDNGVIPFQRAQVNQLCPLNLYLKKSCVAKYYVTADHSLSEFVTRGENVTAAQQ